MTDLMAADGTMPDTFYVVANAAQVKVGITSGDPRPRLSDHRRAGLSREVRLYGALPEHIAAELEDACLRVLTQAGIRPVHGREYFPLRALPVVLDFLDRHDAKLRPFNLGSFLAERLHDCPTCHGRGGARCHGGCHLIECHSCLGQGNLTKDTGPPSKLDTSAVDADDLLISLWLNSSTPREIAVGLREVYSREELRLLAEELLKSDLVAG